MEAETLSTPLPAIQSLSYGITHQQQPDASQWECFERIETVVRHWRYGIEPQQDVQAALKRLASKVREEAIDPQKTLILSLRILFAYWPKTAVEKTFKTEELDALGEETKKVASFMLLFIKQGINTTEPQKLLLEQMVELCLLKHTHKSETRHALINRVLAEVERFFNLLTLTYAELSEEHDDLKSKEIADIDALLQEKFTAKAPEEDVQVLQRWYIERMQCPEDQTPFGGDEPLHSWAQKDLALLVDGLLRHMLDHGFLASAMHERLMNSERFIPPYEKGSDWSKDENQVLTDRLGALMLAGIRMVYDNKRSLAESCLKVFKGAVAGVMKRRVYQLSPMLLNRGMMGKWADTLTPLVEKNLGLEKNKQTSETEAVAATVHHVHELCDYQVLPVRKVLASRVIRPRLNLMTERLAQILFYTQTVRYFLLRHILQAL